MLINGYNRDPLARKKHQIAVSADGGRSYQILGTTDEPLEMVKLQIAAEHAIGMQDLDVTIVDAGTREIEESYSNYVPPPRNMDEPPTDEWLAVRDRWLDAIMKWLLPTKLYAHRNDAKYRRRLGRWFRRNGIEIAIHENGAVRVFRGGSVLSEFGT